MDPIKPEITPEEAFRYCQENPDNLSTEQLLDKFPVYRAELQSLLALNERMSAALSLSMAPGKHADQKARLMAAAAASAGQTTSHGGAVPAKQPNLPGNKLTAQRPRLGWARRAWGSLAAVAVVCLVVWYLAAGALADSPFYGVKLVTENLSLNFAGDTEKLAEAHIKLANQRLYDLRTLQVSGKLAEAQAALDNYIDHMRNGNNIWTGLKGDSHTSLGKLLYISTVAGQSTFEGFSGLIGGLPGALQADIDQIQTEVLELGTSAAQDLRAAGIEPAQLLSQADASITDLLTPVPGVILPTTTPTDTSTSQPTTTPTPTTTAQPTPSPIPCLDSYEDDGVPSQARSIVVGQPQTHSFCPAGDADWLQFQATAGAGYMIQTGQLSPRVNTYLYLFAPDGKTVIKSSGDDPNAQGPAQMTFYPTSTGLYYIQVKDHSDVGYPGADYAISVSRLAPTATPSQAENSP